MITYTRNSHGHDRHRSSGHLHPLPNEELRRVAPSIFAAHAMPGVSEAYSFIPTIAAVDAMRNAGWEPVWVSEQRVRLETREGFQKHMIRFQRAGQIVQAREFCPEICLVNSHDRSSAYQLHAGLFRLVCGNGLIVADATFERVSIRHLGFEPGLIVDASLKVLDSLPQLTSAVESFRARRLSPSESKAFAESAILLRYDELAVAPVPPALLLQPRRHADVGDDLWNTFNRVQENLIRGGLKDQNYLNWLLPKKASWPEGALVSLDDRPPTEVREKKFEHVKAMSFNTTLGSAALEGDRPIQTDETGVVKRTAVRTIHFKPRGPSWEALKNFIGLFGGKLPEDVLLDSDFDPDDVHVKVEVSCAKRKLEKAGPVMDVMANALRHVETDMVKFKFEDGTELKGSDLKTRKPFRLECTGSMPVPQQVDKAIEAYMQELLEQGTISADE